MRRILSGRVGLSIVFGLLGGAVGAIASATYGGNFATPFRFAGVRGYEATGMIGALLGAAILAPCGALVAQGSLDARQVALAWLASLVGAILGLAVLQLLGAAWFWPSMALPIVGASAGYRWIPVTRVG